MDNLEQVREILRYWRNLCQTTGMTIDPDMAARLWVRRYARQWRQRHPYVPEPESTGRQASC
jgi:hypothetical protein